MDALLESKQLRKTFTLGKENEQTILNDVGLRIERGEFVAVMGPSGSGKSTLLYNISGMDRMTSGRVNFDGQELSSLSEKELAGLRLNSMGFIFQHIYRIFSIFRGNPPGGFVYSLGTRSNLPEAPLFIEKIPSIS